MGLFSLLTFFFTLSAFAQKPAVDPSVLDFSAHGKMLRHLDVEAIKKETPPEVLHVYEPLEKDKKNYRGFSVLPLLQKIYGPELSKADAVAIYCTDGYRADIPLNEFKKMKSLLAFAMADGTPFILHDGKKSIPLAPYYLVWDHPNAESAQRDVYRWPYAVNKIDIIDSKKAYARLQLKASSPSLKQGQKNFMKHCFSCHSVNDAGGSRGPMLNGIIKIQKNDFLIKYILDPQGMNPSSKMSGLSKVLKNREAIAQGIVAYIRKIAQ
jgi:mono/diheme cytochrome c family protein